MQGIKNVIFDFGGVIINLDYNKAIEKFMSYTNREVQFNRENMLDFPLFEKQEKGEVSDQEFRDGIRELLDVSLSDEQIDAAWNAMLLDLPLCRIETLKKIEPHFNLYLMSNINNIHMIKSHEIIKNTVGTEDLSPFFKKVYYSHLIGKRKPDLEVYTHLIDDEALVPSETIFLDDKQKNLDGAAAAGMKTQLISNEFTIEDFFKDLL